MPANLDFLGALHSIAKAERQNPCFPKFCHKVTAKSGFGFSFPAAGVGKPQTLEPEPGERGIKRQVWEMQGRNTIEHHLGRKDYHRHKFVSLTRFGYKSC